MARNYKPTPETIEEFLQLAPAQLRERMRAELLGLPLPQQVKQITFLERTASDD